MGDLHQLSSIIISISIIDTFEVYQYPSSSVATCDIPRTHRSLGDRSFTVADVDVGRPTDAAEQM